VTSSTAVLNGRVISNGGSPVDDYFFYVWSDPANKFGINSQYISVSGNNFFVSVQGFAPGVTYFYQAFAHNSSGVDVGWNPGWGAGSVVSFVTPSTVKADLNSDGIADIIWQSSSTGQVVEWFMDGQGRQKSSLTLPPSNYEDFRIRLK